MIASRTPENENALGVRLERFRELADRTRLSGICVTSPLGSVWRYAIFRPQPSSHCLNQCPQSGSLPQSGQGATHRVCRTYPKFVPLFRRHLRLNELNGDVEPPVGALHAMDDTDAALVTFQANEIRANDRRRDVLKHKLHVFPPLLGNVVYLRRAETDGADRRVDGENLKNLVGQRADNLNLRNAPNGSKRRFGLSALFGHWGAVNG